MSATKRVARIDACGRREVRGRSLQYAESAWNFRVGDVSAGVVLETRVRARSLACAAVPRCPLVRVLRCSARVPSLALRQRSNIFSPCPDADR